MNDLHLIDGVVIGFGANNVTELLLQAALDDDGNAIVHLTSHVIGDIAEHLMYLNTQMVHDIRDWLNVWLKENEEKE